MRRVSEQLSRVGGGIWNALRALVEFVLGLRFSPPGARIAGVNDGVRGSQSWRTREDGKVIEEQSFYEQQNEEWHRRKIITVEASAAGMRNQLEAELHITENEKAKIDVRLEEAEHEFREAEQEWKNDLEVYGFNALSLGFLAQRTIFFLIEVPVNFMAFSMKGDGSLFSLAAVLGLSLTVLVAADTIGRRFKMPGARSKVFAGVYLTLLTALVSFVSVFRLDAFQELASRHASLAGTSNWSVAGFYWALQMAFIVFIVERSYSLSQSLEESRKAHLKYARSRYKHALDDLTKLRARATYLERRLEVLRSQLKSLAELTVFRVRQLKSHCVEIRSIYRRHVVARRQEKSTLPPSWLEGDSTGSPQAFLPKDLAPNGNGRNGEHTTANKWGSSEREKVV